MLITMLIIIYKFSSIYTIGKSTTISILTGMITATKGDCFIYDHSVRHNLGEIRKMTGTVYYCTYTYIHLPSVHTIT